MEVARFVLIRGRREVPRAINVMMISSWEDYPDGIPGWGDDAPDSIKDPFLIVQYGREESEVRSKDRGVLLPILQAMVME